MVCSFFSLSKGLNFYKGMFSRLNLDILYDDLSVEEHLELIGKVQSDKRELFLNIEFMMIDLSKIRCDT